jgi:hypothetical protein
VLDWTRFDRISECLALQGFNVIPLPPGAKGAGGSGVLYKHLNKPHSRRVTDADRQQWRETFERKGFTGIVGAYLLPNSGERWHLAIVDVDDPEYLERAQSDFGPTRISVSRGERRRHLYYRTRDPRACHLIGAYGKGTVDIIATTGVVLPGSVHADGDTYELSIPIEEWTEAIEIPEIDTDKITTLRGKHRERVRTELREVREVSPYAGFLHAPEPRQIGDSMWCGHVLPGTLIRTESGEVPLSQLADGTKVFATYRDDAHPSAHVSDARGRRYFWDMSASPARYWTMIDTHDDPELHVQSGDYTAQLTAALEKLGVEVNILHDDGWLSEQLGDLPDNSSTFIIAPHGSGKTLMSKREHTRASTSLSVCNTQALTIANAAVLGLTSVYENVAAKGSVCIASLLKYTQPPEFFHLDEANASHEFLHSGKVDEPLKVWRQLMYFAALSRRSLFTGADLTYEDVALFVDAIRARNATRRIIVHIRVPMRKRVSIHLCATGYAKGEIHRSVRRGSAPLFVGLTTKLLAGQIAQGYRAANAVNTIDIGDVSDVIDSPRPEPVREVTETIGESEAGSDSAFYVSGENSRFHEAVEWLENTEKLVLNHSLIVTSPAVVSGVSLDQPVSRVIVLHENRDIPADSVLQIVRRARNPIDTQVLIGVPAWKPQEHRTDRAYLDDLVSKKATTTIRAITEHFPQFADEHNAEPDPEFARSWRISTRRLIRSHADPIGELVRSAQRHGLEVHTDESPPNDYARERFSEITGAAKAFRESANAQLTAEAEEISSEEMQRLERAPRLESGERHKLDRAILSAFYGVEVTPDLVMLDARGKYRTKVRAYTHVSLCASHADVLAYRDHVRGRGKQPSQRPHDLARAWILYSLILDVLGAEFDGEPLEFSVREIRPGVQMWWREHHQKATSFFPTLRGPTQGYEARWLCERLRSIGGDVSTIGDNTHRHKLATFETVDGLAAAYAGRLFDSYQTLEAETWVREWKAQMQ